MHPTKIALTFLILLLAATAAAAENRAVEIFINRTGPAFDAPAFKTVKQIIGAAVAQSVVDKFVVYGYSNLSGGWFSACAQDSPRSEAITSIVRQLRGIAPRPRTTVYRVKLVAECETDRVACPLDVFTCPDGSFADRVPPSCEFAPCL